MRPQNWIACIREKCLSEKVTTYNMGKYYFYQSHIYTGLLAKIYKEFKKLNTKKPNTLI